MSQQNRDVQKENALILRNETRKGRNTKTRVYNLINDLVDSAVLYDQIVHTGGTGQTKIVSQAGLNTILQEITDSSALNGSNVIDSYTALTTTEFIGVSATTLVNIYLPANPLNFQRIIISDTKGNALSTNITINGNGKLINGDSTAIIDTNYGMLMVIYNGTTWSGGAMMG